MRHTNKIIFLSLLCCSLTWSIQTLALPEDSLQNMHISADSTLFNYKNGFNVYKGNVKIDQGQTHLTSDKLTTQNDDRHKLQEAIAYGTDKILAHYWTIPKAGDQAMHAKAMIIHFYPQKSHVVLQGKVSVVQGNNSFQGEYVEYNIKDQTVYVPPLKKNRATIIIDPNTVNVS